MATSDLLRLVPLLFCCCVGSFGSHALADIAVPEIGFAATYSCRSDYEESATSTLVGIKDGVATYEVRDSNGRLEFVVETPTSAAGLSLFIEWRTAFGLQFSRQKFDSSVLEQYARLRPGSVLKFDVMEESWSKDWSDSQSEWTVSLRKQTQWRYEVTIGQPRIVKHRVLGEVEVVPISESRAPAGSDRSTTTEVLLDPKRGIAVPSNRGAGSIPAVYCELTAIDPS